MCIACFLVFYVFIGFEVFFSFVCVSIFCVLYTVFLSWLHFVSPRLFLLVSLVTWRHTGVVILLGFQSKFTCSLLVITEYHHRHHHQLQQHQLMMMMMMCSWWAALETWLSWTLRASTRRQRWHNKSVLSARQSPLTLHQASLCFSVCLSACLSVM